MRLALYQPDIAPNAGTMLRMCTCLDVPVDIIEPCGFPFSDRSFRRAGMDYLKLADVTRHGDYNDFRAWLREKGRRLVLLTTRAETVYTDFDFVPGDSLIVGRESAGVPDNVHEDAHARLVIPMAGKARSLNVAVAAAMVLGEALRQTRRGKGQSGTL